MLTILPEDVNDINAQVVKRFFENKNNGRNK